MNENIVSRFIENDADSEVGRLMQGCNWVVWHDEDYGRFYNTLLPHAPLKYTRKFGFGLHLGNDKKTNKYAIRGKYGRDISLGLAQDDSDIMFMTIYDYMQGVATITYDEDNVVYLKYQDENGNEFGDTEEEYTIYHGDVSVLRMLQCRRPAGSSEEWSMRAFNRGNPNFDSAVRTYVEMGQAGALPTSPQNNIATWNADDIINNPQTLVFSTAGGNEYIIEQNVEVYTNFYANNPIIYDV